MERLLLRPGEAADALGIGRSKIYELIAAGVIPSVRVGGKSIRVPVDALREWMKDLNDPTPTGQTKRRGNRQQREVAATLPPAA